MMGLIRKIKVIRTYKICGMKKMMEFRGMGRMKRKKRKMRGIIDEDIMSIEHDVGGGNDEDGEDDRDDLGDDGNVNRNRVGYRSIQIRRVNQ